MSSVSQVSVNLNEATATETKKCGRIPHDLGNPKDEPWLHPNAYSLSDTGEWKDLNLKFVLTCYRDYEKIVKVYIDNEEQKERLLKRFYDLSVGIVADGLVWDVDGDDLIENSGCPDQTYDLWTMSGSSAYCGGLWLCALECLRRMASALGRSEDANYYNAKLKNAKKAFNGKLWNGRYFDFDEYSACHKSIMADQLCGFWFMSVVDGYVDESIISREQVLTFDTFIWSQSVDSNLDDLNISQIRTTLQTIYENNVKRFADGRMGAVNAMTMASSERITCGMLITHCLITIDVQCLEYTVACRASGDVDRTSVQSEEVWGGVVYALASLYIITGQNEPGFRTAEGWYRSCWERFGLQYQTPEAITASPGYYRAIGYMRPLSVWALQSALDVKTKAQPAISSKLQNHTS
ncbi:unnamed protein product [Anisakis simplex]|uniref:Glycosyl-hydrolase family 116 catalytic region domain-containing protein n=1 Tax=Anisakis simplex TaxID=6269 RepID=A0A3P6QW66_ANISI|nr:unnamed protein product [Anisakis simplex]